MARLNHTNLVRYYYAWIEFDQHRQTPLSTASNRAYSNSSGGSESVSARGDTLEQTSDSCSISRTESEEIAAGTTPYQQERQHIKVILYIQVSVKEC